MSVNTDSVSNFYLSETDAVPFEARQRVIIEMHEDAKRQADQTLKSAKRLESLRAEFTAEMGKLFGEGKYEKFRQYVSQQNTVLRQEMTPEMGASIPPRQRNELYEKRNRNVRSYLKRIGISEEQMKKIATHYRKRFAKANTRGLPPRVKPETLVPSSQVPKEILKKKTNPWTLKEPPFGNWSEHRRWNTYGFYSILTPVHDIYSGHIYNAPLLITSWPPGDNDWGSANMDVEIGFWYRTSHEGQIEAWIASETTDVYHKLSLWNYWGWSDSYVHQSHYLTLRTSGSSNRSFALMSYHWWDGYTDGHWNIHHLIEDGTYWAHLYTAESFAPNTWVFIWVGSRTYNYCVADDVQTDSYPVAHWYLKRVYVD